MPLAELKFRSYCFLAELKFRGYVAELKFRGYVAELKFRGYVAELKFRGYMAELKFRGYVRNVLMIVSAAARIGFTRARSARTIARRRSTAGSTSSLMTTYS